jgi:hypothetical protein
MTPMVLADLQDVLVDDRFTPLAVPNAAHEEVRNDAGLAESKGRAGDGCGVEQVASVDWGDGGLERGSADLADRDDSTPRPRAEVLTG